MELENVMEEYLYHCKAKGYTAKTMIDSDVFADED